MSIKIKWYKKNEWIASNERKPEAGMDVLVIAGLTNSDMRCEKAQIIRCKDGTEYWSIKTSIHAWRKIPSPKRLKKIKRVHKSTFRCVSMVV